MIDVYEYSGEKEGPNFLITGGVHGNEICGVKAIERFIKELDEGIFSLERGCLRLIPCCNPKAYAEDKRYIDVNLNRVIAPKRHPQLYEEKLAQEIIPHLNWADMGLDLHSYTASNEPFVFCDSDFPALLDYSKIAVADFIVTGFDEMLSNQNVQTFYAVQSYYMTQNKCGVTIECGQHKSPTSIDIAYQNIIKYLQYYGIIKFVKDFDGRKSKAIYRVKQIVYKEKEGDLVKPFTNLDPVKKGDGLIVYHDGETILAPFDGVVLLPSPTSIGEDWFYLAQKQ